MSVQHIDALTGEILDGPPKYRPSEYKDKPRHSEAELRYMRIRGTNRPSKGPVRRDSTKGDVNTALLTYALLMTLYALSK